MVDIGSINYFPMTWKIFRILYIQKSGKKSSYKFHDNNRIKWEICQQNCANNKKLLHARNFSHLVCSPHQLIREAMLKKINNSDTFMIPQYAH